MLTSRTLESFIEVAKKKNIKTASTSLNLTASPISRRIKILESWVGFKLFVRMQNDFVLTERGRAFYEDILPCHEKMSVLEKAYKSRSCNEHKVKPLKVGIELLSNSVINRFVEYFRGRKEINRVLYLECNKDSALDKLLAEEIDLLFSHRSISHDRISFMELNAQPLWLMHHQSLEDKINDKSIRSIFVIEQKTIDQDNINRVSNYICTSFPNADMLIVNSFLPYLDLVESGDAVFLSNETPFVHNKQNKNLPTSSAINKMKIKVSLKTHVYFLKENEDISRQLAGIV